MNYNEYFSQHKMQAQTSTHVNPNADWNNYFTSQVRTQRVPSPMRATYDTTVSGAMAGRTYANAVPEVMYGVARPQSMSIAERQRKIISDMNQSRKSSRTPNEIRERIRAAKEKSKMEWDKRIAEMEEEEVTPVAIKEEKVLNVNIEEPVIGTPIKETEIITEEPLTTEVEQVDEHVEEIIKEEPTEEVITITETPEVKEELIKKELIKEELIKKELIKEEPVKEEPVKEEPLNLEETESFEVGAGELVDIEFDDKDAFGGIEIEDGQNGIVMEDDEFVLGTASDDENQIDFEAEQPAFSLVAELDKEETKKKATAKKTGAKKQANAGKKTKKMTTKKN